MFSKDLGEASGASENLFDKCCCKRLMVTIPVRHEGRQPVTLADRNGVRCPRAMDRHLRSRAARASSLPALRPVRGVRRWKCGEASAGVTRPVTPAARSLARVAPLGCVSPFGRNRGGTPIGERPLQRASCTARYRGYGSASFGVPLSFFCRKRGPLSVMLREGGASSNHRGDGDYWIVRLRGR
jgi:hypothetical protein